MREPARLQMRIARPHLRHEPGEKRHLLQHVEGQIAGTKAVIDIMRVVSDVVGDRRNLRLQTGIGGNFEIMDFAIVQDGLRHRAMGALAVGRHQRTVVFDQAFERLPGKIEPVEFGITPLELRHDAQGLRIVVEAAIGQQHLVQRVFAGVPEGRVAEIVNQRHAFGQILIQLQRARQGASNLRNFDRMRQARAVVIAVLSNEHLRLVLQSPEGRRVDDPVAVTLEFGARRARPLFIEPASRCPRVRRVGGLFSITETQCMPVDRHYLSIPALVPCALKRAKGVSFQSANGIPPNMEQPSPLTSLCSLHTYRQENSKMVCGSTTKP